MRPFGEVCDTRLGKLLDQKQQTGEHPRRYLRKANVQWFRFDLAEVFEMDFDARSRSILRLKSGDLLICEGGEPGRAAIWKDEIEAKAVPLSFASEHLWPRQFFSRGLFPISESLGSRSHQPS